MSWKKIPLSKLCVIEKGKIGINKAIPGEYPLVTTAEERLSHNEYHFEGNAVIIPLVSSTGHGHRSLKRIHYQTGKFSVGSILAAVMPKDEKVLRADYLFRFLCLNKENELVGRMRGMANVTLPVSEIGKIEITIPPVDQQIEFVNNYTNLEKHSDSFSYEFTHQLDLVKQLRQAFLREAMQGKLVPQDPNDEPASVLLEKIKAEKERLIKEKKIKKDKPLPPITEDEIPYELPEGWVWCRFGEICEIESNLVRPDDFLDLPHIAPNNIEKNTGKLLEYNTVKEDDLISNKHYFFPGQLLYSKVRPKLNKIVEVDFEGLCSADMYPLKPYINSRFLLNCMLSAYFVKEVDKFDNRVKMPKINQNQLSQILVPLPSLSEQHRIVAKLDQLMQHCDQLEVGIMQSQQHNEQLLQQVLREALEG